MKTVDELLQELKDLRVRKKSFDGSYYNIEVIDSDGFNMVENIIREFLLDHHDGEIGEMQGKIFAYEEIIKKSNFAPFAPDCQSQPYSLDISKAETEKIKRIFGETDETTEEETMFYSEFLESDDWKQAQHIEYFDLSGNVVGTRNDSDKILKYYNREVCGFKFMIVFIEK